MRLKSFHAPTMAEAMRLVREVLGDDAIIVATREEDGVGVRVTAAVEEDDLVHTPAAAPPVRVMEDLGPDLQEQVGDVLLRHGVPQDLNARLLDSIADLDAREPSMALSAALDSIFAFQPLGDGTLTRPIMLVGPPGAGKTLTVAKLCARAAVRGRKVGVVSTDTERAGGLDQLAAFTRVLKLRLITVEDPHALADAMAVQQGMEQVIVDSAGRNPFDPKEMAEVRDMVAAARVEPVLVMPAGMDAAEAGDIARAFREVGVRRMIPTRLDMARRLGSILTAAFEADLALCEAGTTPKVADGLTVLTPTQLARLMMPEAEAAQRRPKQTGTHA